MSVTSLLAHRCAGAGYRLRPWRTASFASDAALGSARRSVWRRRRRRATLTSAAAVAAVAAATVPQATAPRSGDPGDLGDPAPDDDCLPLRYDAQLVKRYWDRRPLRVFLRSCEVWWQFVPFLSKLVLWEVALRGKILRHEGLQRKYAVRLRQILTELGPCFVKLGQALSIRPDLLPNPVLMELQKLCDAVPSFPTKVAIEVGDQCSYFKLM